MCANRERSKEPKFKNIRDHLLRCSRRSLCLFLLRSFSPTRVDDKSDKKSREITQSNKLFWLRTKRKLYSFAVAFTGRTVRALTKCLSVNILKNQHILFCFQKTEFMYLAIALT